MAVESTTIIPQKLDKSEIPDEVTLTYDSANDVIKTKYNYTYGADILNSTISHNGDSTNGTLSDITDFSTATRLETVKNNVDLSTPYNLYLQINFPAIIKAVNLLIRAGWQSYQNVSVYSDFYIQYVDANGTVKTLKSFIDVGARSSYEVFESLPILDNCKGIRVVFHAEWSDVMPWIKTYIKDLVVLTTF